MLYIGDQDWAAYYYWHIPLLVSQKSAYFKSLALTHASEPALIPPHIQLGQWGVWFSATKHDDSRQSRGGGMGDLTRAHTHKCRDAHTFTHKHTQVTLRSLTVICLIHQASVPLSLLSPSQEQAAARVWTWKGCWVSGCDAWFQHLAGTKTTAHVKRQTSWQNLIVCHKTR